MLLFDASILCVCMCERKRENTRGCAGGKTRVPIKSPLSETQKDDREKPAPHGRQKGTIVGVRGPGLGKSHQGRQQRKGDPELDRRKGVVVGGDDDQGGEKDARASLPRARKFALKEFALCWVGENETKTKKQKKTNPVCVSERVYARVHIYVCVCMCVCLRATTRPGSFCTSRYLL
mmetsp:Transcript_5652/g.13041  ORF Transcript_5652/g.13041 Transcript_5652/m.13041 type:complete len:177 (+) Transcript_5652:1087-1617(+)